MNKKMIFTFIASALLVTGCGGGGGSSSGGTSSGLSITASPTAKFSTSSQTDANSLATEIQGGTPALVNAVAMQTMPLGISTLPAGISADCSTLGSPGGGTMTYDTNMPSSGTPTTGTYVNMTFNSCSFTSGTLYFTLNGAASITYTRYNSSTDFATSNSYTSFTMAIVDSSTTPVTSNSFGPITATFTLDDSNGAITVATQLPNGGVTDLVSSNLYTSGTSVDIINATYVYNSSAAGGIINVVYNNWTYDPSTGYPISGTITVTDANGNTVVIDANSTATGTVTVTYTIGGTVTSYTVTFP